VILHRTHVTSYTTFGFGLPPGNSKFGPCARSLMDRPYSVGDACRQMRTTSLESISCQALQSCVCGSIVCPKRSGFIIIRIGLIIWRDFTDFIHPIFNLCCLRRPNFDNDPVSQRATHQPPQKNACLTAVNHWRWTKKKKKKLDGVPNWHSTLVPAP